MPLVREVLTGEVERLRATRGDVPYEPAHLDVAARLLDRLVAEPRFAPFLTLLAYREIH
jgi:hypothetical protein